jgi:transposase
MEQTIRTNVGLDISKDTYWATITVLSTSRGVKNLKSEEFKNSKAGFRMMERWVKEAAISTSALHFTMEATGVYHERIAHYLHDKQYLVHIVLPNKAKKFAESLDARSKTDKLDSKALGRFGAERNLTIWYPSNPIFKELKSLTRERATFIHHRTQLKNNLHALKHSHNPNKATLKRMESTVKGFDKNVKSIESEIIATIKGNDELRRKIAFMVSIPGVGVITAAVVAAETDGFSMIGNVRQLCSYAGLDIVIKESGKWKGKSRISKKGNSHIRAALYLPSLSTIRYSQQHKAFYERIVDGKKKPKIGITAVSRKLLVLMYTLWKNEEKYEDKHLLKEAA